MYSVARFCRDTVQQLRNEHVPFESDATSPDGRIQVMILGGKAFFGETAKIEAQRKQDLADWQASFARVPGIHREQAATFRTEGHAFAEAYHLRQLLRYYAFGDLDYAARLRDAERRLDRQAPMPRAVP